MFFRNLCRFGNSEKLSLYPNLYHYLDLEKRQIDLLIINAEDVYPIRIKRGGTPDKADKNVWAEGQLGMNVKPATVISSGMSLIPCFRNVRYFSAAVLQCDNST